MLVPGRQAGWAKFGWRWSCEAPKEFPGVGTTLFTCTTPKGLNLHMGGGGRRAMRAGAVPPAQCQAKNVRVGRPGEPRPVLVRARSRPKRAMLLGRGGQVDLGPAFARGLCPGRSGQCCPGGEAG